MDVCSPRPLEARKGTPFSAAVVVALVCHIVVSDAVLVVLDEELVAMKSIWQLNQSQGPHNQENRA